MTNSDYLIKAAVKKLSEKFNQTFSEKIEEVNTVAQEFPGIFKKELEILINEIIKEAECMKEDANSSSKYEYENEIKQKDNLKNKCDKKIKEIHFLLKDLNKELNIQP